MYLKGSMSRISVLYKKEFKQLFFSFTGFLSILVSPLFLSTALIYFLGFFSDNKADFSSYTGLFPVLIILILPLLTLKNFIDDNKFGTDELLLTLPFSEKIIVWARFGAVFTVYLIILASSAILPLTMLPVGNFDRGILFSSFFGIILNGAASVSLCMFISILTGGTIVSWLLSSVLLIFLNGSYMADGIISLFTFSVHMESFSRGLLNPGDIIYFLIITAFFLYISSKLIYIRRWN